MHRIPVWILPSSVTSPSLRAALANMLGTEDDSNQPFMQLDDRMVKQLCKKLKPDGLMICPLPHGAHDYEVRIIEIKYARDTDATKQGDNAESQHALLRRLLREQSQYTVHQHTMLLGTGGTIFKDIALQLTELGVEHHHAPKVTKELHIHSVKALSQIVMTKRYKESMLKSYTARPP